jgi:hypothetical protein
VREVVRERGSEGAGEETETGELMSTQGDGSSPDEEPPLDA